MRFVKLIGLMMMIALTSACAVEKNASSKNIAAVSHVSEERPYIAVVSMVNRGSGRAAHTAMLINASQRVIYDPAGTFQHPELQERGDIHYGVNDRMLSYYNRYHARFSHYVHTQKVYVSAETAEAVLRRTQAQGASPKMFCTIHTGEILKDIPQFSHIQPGFFPEGLRRQMASVPGVIDSYVIEEDREKVVPTN